MISDHQATCDLVAKPDTGPLRGWVCTCKGGILAAPIPHHQDCPFNGLAGADPDANLCPYCPPLHACEKRVWDESRRVTNATLTAYRKHEGCDDAGHAEGYLDGYSDALAKAREAAAILHEPFHDGNACRCGQRLPCPTLAAIDALSGEK
jgi:hypothetical protein